MQIVGKARQLQGIVAADGSCRYDKCFARVPQNQVDGQQETIS